MDVKRKLILGTATAILGLSLVGAPTYAYLFSTDDSNIIKTAGDMIDLNTNTKSIIQVKNIKPGDKMTRSFTLSNGGMDDIRSVFLDTSYIVKDSKNNGTEDFGKHIQVNFMWNKDKAISQKWPPDNIIYKTTLYNLKKMAPNMVNNKLFIPFFEEQGGLKPGDSDELFVQFEFVDNNQKQDVFQGDTLELKWTFEGIAD